MKKFTVFTLLFALFFAMANSQNLLVSISPDSAGAGQLLTTTITGNNTLFQASSPQGNLGNVYLQLGATGIYGDPMSIFITDNEHFDITFNIPGVATPGLYDLIVDYYDPNLAFWYTTSLPQSFTVGPVNGYISGQVFEDLNKNGIKDVGEPGVLGQKISISPYNYFVFTDSSGNYSFAVPNGTYSISYLTITGNYKFLDTATPLSVTINNNNSPGNNFGVHTGITTVSPSSGLVGQTIQFLVVSEDSVFRTNANPYGNITYAGMKKSGGNYWVNSTLASSVTVLSWDSAIITLNIPNSVNYVGNFDFYVITSSPIFGTHKISNAVTIGAAQSYISGILYFDVNANGIYDTGDVGLPNKKVIVQPDNIFGFSSAGGLYSTGIYNGNKTITPVSDPYFVLSSSPSSYSVNASNNTYPNKDFGFTTGLPLYDIAVNFIGLPRCNTTQPFTLSFINNGNAPVSGIAYAVTSANMVYVTANPMPSSISGDTLFFNFNSIPVGGSYSAIISYTLPSIGNTVSYDAHVDVINGSTVVYSKDRLETSIVRCSCDPNDKACMPAGVQSENYTLMSDELLYKVRFQNTGNDTAFLVRIFDVLDPDLDWNTFRLVSSSHPVTTSLDMNTGLVIFTFNNILLVDSTTNEPGSNGYVTYTVEVDSGLADYTPITNTADIYFDSNSPIVTNTTKNTMVYVIPVGLNETDPQRSTSIIIPNPATERALLQFDNIGNNHYILKIYNVKGEIMTEQNVSTGESRIYLDKYSAGIYMYELTPVKEGTLYRGKFIVQ